MPSKPKRSQAQKEADKRYAEKNKANQRDNFKNISATFKKAEAERIAKVFAEHGLKSSEIIRGAAVALMNGETIRTHSQPIPTDTQADSTDTDAPPIT